MAWFCKNFIKGTARLLGIELRRLQKWDRNKFLWLQDFDVQTIFDIGANTGQFSQEIHAAFPRSKIYAFEPLDDCIAALQKNLSKLEGIRAYSFALGDFNGEALINKNDFLPSSSLLPMKPSHREIFPHTQNSSEEKISIKRLDDVVRGADWKIQDDLLIKIDVQGFEDRIIAGGKETIARAKIVIIEVSYIELYEGQLLFAGIYSQLQELGFEYAGNREQLLSQVDGRPIQADAIFLKDCSRA